MPDTAAIPSPETVTDDAGHVWRPVVDAAFVRRAKLIGVDVARLVRREPKVLIDTVAGDVERLGSLVYLACHEQAVEYAVSPEAFATLMAGRGRTADVLQVASVIVLVGVARLFPDSKFGRAAHAKPFLVPSLLKR
ncbi:hypothetical protein [Gemmata sp.]|uniref:hypothetical protein n=1 Tax=Gemmata sp. TaxID=1914242 RepID=UPI003F705F8F